MLSEKNQAAVIAVFGHPIMLDEEGQDWNALLDHVRHQAQEEAKAVSVEGWRPIETAPRDGTGILVYNAFGGVYHTAFTTRWTGEPGEEPYEGFPCGFAVGLGHPFGKWDYQPTHWMPLPAAPGASPNPPRDKRPVAQCGGEAIAAMLEEDRLPPCPVCGAPRGSECRTIQGVIPPHEERFALTPPSSHDLEGGEWMTSELRIAVEPLSWWPSGGNDCAREMQELFSPPEACRVCGGDCSSANPPVVSCPLRDGATASTTPDIGAEKVATVAEDEGSREALNPLPNQHTRDRIAELEGMVRELADDLESELNARYEGTRDHPAMARRYERDMDSVTRARAALQAKEAD